MADERLRATGSIRAAFPNGQLGDRMKRLFWSWSAPPSGAELEDPQTALHALATILAEGDADDWRSLDQRVLCSVADELPLFGPLAAVWVGYYREEKEMEDRRKEVLEDEQRQILRLAAKVLPHHLFELAGGTALAAAYLGHRRSEDLDFFTAGASITEGLAAFSTELRQMNVPVSVELQTPSFARLQVGQRPTKVELAVDSPYHLRPTERRVEGMPVRSLPDLAADKTLALFGRATTRDFIDVYQLMRTHYDLSTLMRLAAQKDPGFNPAWFAKALGRVVFATPRDVQMLVPFDFDRMREDLLAASRRILRQELDRGDELER